MPVVVAVVGTKVLVARAGVVAQVDMEVSISVIRLLLAQQIGVRVVAVAYATTTVKPRLEAQLMALDAQAMVVEAEIAKISVA